MTVDRTELRAWLEANCPPEMREPPGEDDICWGGRRFMFRSEAQKLWLERCVARGLTVPTWPKEYGGGRLVRARTPLSSRRKCSAFTPARRWSASASGCSARRCLKFGSPEQKATHLPRIARGEIRWCQGYSEPGAGSDLASLRTKAEDRGDHFLVNGQKIWTSYADKADWIFCLVRTDPQAVKQKGISFLLIDMASPGRLDEADRADLRQVAVLRDVLRQCRGSEGKPGRNAQSRLGRRQIPAHARARDDRRRRQPIRHPCARPGGCLAGQGRKAHQSDPARRDRPCGGRHLRVGGHSAAIPRRGCGRWRNRGAVGACSNTTAPSSTNAGTSS